VRGAAASLGLAALLAAGCASPPGRAHPAGNAGTGKPAAEYSLLLSASDDDPDVHEGAPTGTPRPVYLWLRCGELGAAACEGRLRGDLPVLGFTPSEGILDIGRAPVFRLAIPGCPRDTTILLGHFDVWDSGGTLELADPPDGKLGVVDCRALPELDADVRTAGFTSATGGAGTAE